MTEKRVSVLRRYHVGIASVLFSAFSAPAVAGESSAPEVFLGAMSQCLDWIADGAPDAVPFGGWTAETAFPTGTTDEGAEAGAYKDPDGGLVVSLQRGAGGVSCTGQQGGVTQEALGDALFAWVAQESEAGRIAMTPQGHQEFGYSIAVCVGQTGGADVIPGPDDDQSLIFYFETGDKVPPEGACDV